MGILVPFLTRCDTIGISINFAEISKAVIATFECDFTDCILSISEHAFSMLHFYALDEFFDTQIFSQLNNVADIIRGQMQIICDISTADRFGNM